MSAHLIRFALGVALVSLTTTVRSKEMTADLEARFQDAANRTGAVLWTPDFDAAGALTNGFLDGERGQVERTSEGFLLRAGPQPRANADHVVLWTDREFMGDLRIDFDYTRRDEADQDVNILYLFARGSGKEPYARDIASWREIRREAKMSWYFAHMQSYHISFAAFGDDDHPGVDYVRARRYLPERERPFQGTALGPDSFDTGRFLPGVAYHCTVLREGPDLFFNVTSKENADDSRLFHWDLRQAPPLDQGRIGLRHMAARSAQYDHLEVRTINPAVPQPSKVERAVDWSHASPRSQRYRVWVDGEEVFVGDFWSQHFTQFRWQPGTEVEVELCDEDIDPAQTSVSPLRLDVGWKSEGKRLRFKLDRPHAYVVRANTPQGPGVELNYLTLLAENPEDWAAAAESPRAGEIDVVTAGVDPTGIVDATPRLEQMLADADGPVRLYFPLGTYSIEDWVINRGQVEVRLAPGAFLHAKIPGDKTNRRHGVRVLNAPDFKMSGLGMIEAHGYAFSVNRAPDFVIDGPIIRTDALGKVGVTPKGNEDGGRGLMLGFSDRYHIRNVKIFSVIDQEAGKGKDAMNLASSSDGLVEGCFTISGDDTYTIKGRHDSGEWLQLDLGREVDLGATVIEWGLSGFSRYAVLGSLDGKTWTEIVKGRELDPTTLPIAERIVLGGRARWLRLQSQGDPIAFHHADFVREWEVYGDDAAKTNLARGAKIETSPFGQPWSAAHVPAMAVDGDRATAWANSYFSERVHFRDNVAIVVANAIKIGTGADYAGSDILWEDHDVIDAGWAHSGMGGGGMIDFSHYNFDHRPEAMAMRRISVKNARFEDSNGLFEIGWIYRVTGELFIFATDLEAELENVTWDTIHPGFSAFRVIADPDKATIRVHFRNMKVAGKWIRGLEDLRELGVSIEVQGLSDDDEITFEVIE